MIKNSSTLNPKKYQLLSGSTLKFIATATMLIDHIGAVVLSFLPDCSMEGNVSLYNLYLISRNIGRTAFPLYCFLLVEGFFHTKSKEKYALRLFLFALLSEIPFDLAIKNSFFSFRMQNVFFTLLLGFLCMLAVDKRKKQAMFKGFSPNMLTCDTLLIILIFIGLATILKTDYYGLGIILIMIFYFYQDYPVKACAIGYFSFLWEPFCFPAFLLIPLYNGRKGISCKYFFYFFYPVHLTLLYFLRLYLTQ